MLNSIHTFAGFPVEPVDLHASFRHLEAAYDAHTLTDKPFHQVIIITAFTLAGAMAPITIAGAVVRRGAPAVYGGFRSNADFLNMGSTFLDPVDVSHDALAVDAIAAVDPAGHFFGEEYTQARHTTEFYEPMVSDWRSWETWTEGGSPDANRRISEGGVPTDFSVRRRS